ncbi:hypothetical protein PVW47_08250 [Marinovum sp. SP66]|uniref:hypothetical protein n=1 Tax=Marinovum TaxID=367771 RepID=UPI00237B4131|nr:hypothetical protein [Marinovum sp. SP66]MDD9739764.1 hypothetical protein [Marinovum sp. SP66]
MYAAAMRQRYYYRPWKDESLVSALHFMRCRIIREGLEGQEHADALLCQLGVAPESLPLPRKIPHYFKRGELQRAIFDALRCGPLTGAEIAERVRAGLDPKAAYRRTYQALWAMQKNGMVQNDRGLWSLMDGEGDP